MSLGSVVPSIRTNIEPLPVRRTGYGREVIGFGETAVMGASFVALPVSEGR